MKIQAQLDELIQKKLTRKEFLRGFGLIILSIVGLSGFLKYLGKDNFLPSATPSSYGMGPYGGLQKDSASSNSAPKLLGRRA